MYVVPIKKILDPSFGFGDRIRSHEELKAEGLLVVYEEDMQGEVLFCSHTWLRRSHPDSVNGIKLTLLKQVLQRAVDGKLEIKPAWQCELVYGKAARDLRMHAPDMRRDLADGYVFFDYCSIPQADPEAQKRAIASLVNYVNASAYFMCLAGPWTHEDGSSRDDLAWSGRGWCRMELTANALSVSAKPVILACSPTRIVTLAPAGAIGREFMVAARVGHGAFTVEADKKVLGPVLHGLITARKALALADGDMIAYRTLHAATNWLLDGCGVAEPAPEPYDEWMAAMHFKTAKDKSRGTGVTPLYYAIMAGRADLVDTLLERGAKMDCNCKRNVPAWGIMQGALPLVAAASFARDGSVIAVLLHYGANPRQRFSPLGDNALLAATIVGNVEGVRALMRHDATLADEPLGLGCQPFFQLWATGHPRMFETLRNEYPRQLETTVRNLDTARLGGFGLCGYAIANNAAHLDLLTATLEMGEPVDRYSPKVKGFFRPVIGIMSLYASLRPISKLPQFAFVISYLFRSSAVHFAAAFGNMQALNFLIERGADIHSKANPKGMTPLILAAIGGHDDVCERLLVQGAKVGAKDRSGRTALSYAKRLGHEAVTRRLIALTSDVPPAATSKPVQATVVLDSTSQIV